MWVQEGDSFILVSRVIDDGGQRVTGAGGSRRSIDLFIRDNLGIKGDCRRTIFDGGQTEVFGKLRCGGKRGVGPFSYQNNRESRGGRPVQVLHKRGNTQV